MEINTSKQKYYAEFSNKKFKNKKLFEKWLGKHCKYIVEFVDQRQDCLEWRLDEGGEVVDCNLQAQVWNGMIVNLFKLEKGRQIGVMVTKHQATRFYDFIVSDIKPYEENN